MNQQPKHIFSNNLLMDGTTSSLSSPSFMQLDLKPTPQGVTTIQKLNKQTLTNEQFLTFKKPSSFLISDCVSAEKPSKHLQINHHRHQSFPSTINISKKTQNHCNSKQADSPSRDVTYKNVLQGQQQHKQDIGFFEKCFPIISENNAKITQQISARKVYTSGSYLHLGTEGEESKFVHVPQTKLFNEVFSVQINKTSIKPSQITVSTDKHQLGLNLQTGYAQQTNVNISEKNQAHIGSTTVNRTSLIQQESSNNSSLISQSAGIKQSHLETNSGSVYQLEQSVRNPLREAQVHTSKFHTNPSSSFSTQQFQQQTLYSPQTKFTRIDENGHFGSNGKISKKNSVSARDIQHVQDLQASKADQHQLRFKTKTEHNLQLLLSPRVNSVLQKQRTTLFDAKRVSCTDLRYGAKGGQQAVEKSTKNNINAFSVSSAQFLSPSASGMFGSQNKSIQEGIADPSSFAQKNYYFPTQLLEEFLEAVKQTNLGGGISGGYVNQKLSNGLGGAHIIQSVHGEIQQMLANQKSTSDENCVRSSLAELAYSLKKAHPSLFTGQPSGRAEVQVLQEWLEGTLSQVIADKEGGVEERFQRVDDALILSFNELVRQVSYQCKERGILMLSVFSCYFSLTKKMSLFEQDEKRRMKIQNEIEILQMQKTADGDIESKISQINSLQELLALEKQKTQGIAVELRMAEDREKAVFAKYEKVKAFNDLAKVQVIKMKREIDDLRHRLSCKEAFQQKKIEKVLIDYKTTLKKQLSGTYISSRLEEADQKLLNSIADLSAPPPNQKDQEDDVDEKMQLSFTEIIKEADENTRMVSNEVIIKSVMEEKSTALICQEMQTDPMLSLTYNKSVKCQTDLDFMDSKFDKVFSTKKQVEDYLREQQLKAELFSLEEFASEQQDVSIDQDLGDDSMVKNTQKPVLSNIFAGLPIKKLKKKISKNNLNKFIENIGILYNYIKQQDTTSGKDIKQSTQKEIKSSNSTKKDNLGVTNAKEFKSMREIQEVDEPQEDHENPSVQNIEGTKRLSKRGSIIAASLNVLQSRMVEFHRTPKKSNTIASSNKSGKDHQSSKERSILKESIKQSLEMTLQATSTTAELIQVIQKQQLIIEKLQNLALPEDSLDSSFNESGKKSASSFTNLNSHLLQDSHIPSLTYLEQQQHGTKKSQGKTQNDHSLTDSLQTLNPSASGFIQQQQQQALQPQSSLPAQLNQQPSNSSLQQHLKSVLVNSNNNPPSQKALSKRMSLANPLSQGPAISGAQKKAISFISTLQSPQHRNSTSRQQNSLPSSSSIDSHKKDQVLSSSQLIQQQQAKITEEDLPNFNSFYGKSNTNNVNTSIGDMDQDDENNNNNSIDEEAYYSPDLPQPIEYQDNEFKQQIVGLLQLYNMEIEKNSNLRESLEELIKLLREIYLFAKLLFMHIKKTQKHTHKSIIEGFIQQFTSLKWKLPKEFDSNFEKEIMKEDKEDINKKLLRLKFSNKRSAQRFIAHVQKNQAFTKLSIFDKNAHFGFIIANKIKESGIPKKFAAFLPLKNTLKYIQNLIDERVRMVREKRLPTDQDMPIFTFNKFLQLFGFRRVAESKYTQFMFSVMHYQSIFRVNMFARLLTITNDKKANYTTEEMEKYFNAYEFIINISTMGVQNPQHSETDSTLNIALLKAMDYIKVVLEKIMPFEDITELRTGLDAIKDVDQKSASKTLMVDFDVFMSKVLCKYRLLMNKTQLFVKNAFFAADLDGNGRINLNEFLTLFRHIMPARFNLMKCIQMFENGADIITEDQKNLSFEKFTALCIDFNLFTTAMQDKYIRVTSKDEISKQLSVLKANWLEEDKKIAEKLEILKPFVVSQSYKNWIEILKVLETRLNEENIVEENQRPILIAFKLLNDELERLIEEGKKGNEDNEDDDDDDDNDLFNFKDDDDNELSSLLKTINNKNINLHQISPPVNNPINSNSTNNISSNPNIVNGNNTLSIVEEEQRDILPSARNPGQK